MDNKSYSTNFEYEGEQHSLEISIHNHYKDGYLFAFYINNFFSGTLYKDGNMWLPLHAIPITDKNRQNEVFELQGHDYSVIGELIEEHLSECV